MKETLIISFVSNLKQTYLSSKWKISTYQNLKMIADQQQHLMNSITKILHFFETLKSETNLTTPGNPQNEALHISNKQSKYKLIHGNQFKDMLDPRDLVLQHNFDFKIILKQSEYLNDYYNFLESSEYVQIIKQLKKFLIQAVSNVISISFKYLNDGKLQEKEALNYSAQNIMINIQSVFFTICKSIQKNSQKLTRKNTLIEIKNNLISKIEAIIISILINLADNYPQAPITGGTPRINSVIKEINRVDDESNDLIFSNNIKLSDFLKTKKSKNFGIEYQNIDFQQQDYTEFIMETINTVIQVVQSNQYDERQRTNKEIFKEFKIFMRLGSGMFWSRVESGSLYCNSMWRQILFISNFVENGDNQCLGWGWYLQVDFQLFIIGLILLYVYSKSKKIFLITSIILCTLSVIFNFVYSYHLDLRLFTDLEAFINFEDFMLYLYMKPYGRWTPYIIGLIAGVYYMQFKSWLKNKKEQHQNLFSKIRTKFLQSSKFRKAIQWIGISLMAFLTFIPSPLQTGSQWPLALHSLYWSLSKPIFIIALFMVVIPTALGIKRSFFELILNCKLLMVIARISFCTYLVHLMVIYQVIYVQMVIYQVIYVQNNDYYYDLRTMFVIYMGILVLSLVLGFLLTILVEVPFSNLLKSVMKNRIKNDSQNVGREQKQSLITTTESLLIKQNFFEPEQRQSIN